MAKPLLSRDEIVVRHMRTHPKALLSRGLAEILLLACAVAASVLLPQSWSNWRYAVIWILALLLSLPLLVVPWVRWLTETYTVTTKRVITRSGIFNKTGHDLPLSRVSDVQIDRGITDRIFGCGTLSLQTSANDPLLLKDVPAVQIVQVEISNLLFNDIQGALDADPDD